MSFIIAGLPVEPFQPLFGLDEVALAARGVVRMAVDSHPGFPCRVTLEDAPPGATALLLNFEHQPAATPYRSRHAIFVREGAVAPTRFEDVVPPVLASRLLSVRAFDAGDMMLDAEVVEGVALVAQIERMFANPAVAYLHAHAARRGCFIARIDRA